MVILDDLDNILISDAESLNDCGCKLVISNGHIIGLDNDED